jgi:hypothetical protein
MARFTIVESADLIWMGWNLFLRELMDEDWDGDSVAYVHQLNAKCREGAVLRRELGEKYSHRLFLRNVKNVLEGRFLEPRGGIKDCTAPVGI